MSPSQPTEELVEDVAAIHFAAIGAATRRGVEIEYLDARMKDPTDTEADLGLMPSLADHAADRAALSGRLVQRQFLLWFAKWLVIACLALASWAWLQLLP